MKARQTRKTGIDPAPARETRSQAPRRASGQNTASREINESGATQPESLPLPSPEREPRAAGSRIGFLIHDVSRMRSTLYDQAVRPLNLTRSQWWVLGQLSRQRAPHGVLQTELARALDIGKVTVGGLIDRLEERGFIERRPDIEDRRAKRVLVTRAGRDVLKQMVRLSEDLNATVFAGFSDADMQMTESVLARMKANIRQELEDD